MVYDNTFGVEIECVLPENKTMGDLADFMTANGVPCRNYGYCHQTRPFWKVVSDGSVRDGAEIVSPILKGEEGFESVRKACAILRKFGCTINATCGLHIHVGVSDQEVEFFKNLFRIYGYFEKVIDKFMPPSRRESANTYCSSITNEVPKVEKFKNLEDVRYSCFGRYYKVNLEAYDKYGTIEFRHHSGSLDGTKIISWIIFCLKVVERAKQNLPEFFLPKYEETIVKELPPQPHFYRRWSNEAVVMREFFARAVMDVGMTSREAGALFNGKISLGQLIKKYALDVTIVQESHEKRFFLKKVEKKVKTWKTSIPQDFLTLENLSKFIGLNNLEASFFQERTEALETT